MPLDTSSYTQSAERPTMAKSEPAKPGFDVEAVLGKLGISLTPPVKEKDRIMFTERLALLLETGVPLHAALVLLEEQTDNVRLRRVIGAVLKEVLEGTPFSVALARYPDVFPISYVNLVAASEKGGFMHEVLVQLVEVDEKQQRLSDTIRGALAYPVFLSVFSVAVVIFVLTVVFPKFADMFARIYDSLPVTTRFLMVASNLLLNHWAVILATVFGVVAGLVLWVKSPQGAAITDYLKISLPVVRTFFIEAYMVAVMRIMAISIANSVPVLDALIACRASVSNREFKKFLSSVESQLREGKDLAQGFQSASFIPSMVKQMITTGDATGNLALSMRRIAEFYERVLTQRVATISKMAEPIMLMVMGTVVGLIVSAIILPIFKLSKAV